MRCFIQIILAIVFTFTISGAVYCPSVFAKDNIKIAVILAHSGPAKISDICGLPAAELAVEAINAKGGVLGRHLEIISLDTQSTPIGAIKAARKAIEYGVVGVIGAGWSSQSLPLAKALQKAGIPMITPSSTHPDVTKVGDYIFRVCFTDSFQGSALAKFARNDLLTSTAAILQNISESYSQDLARQFTHSYEASGGKILWQGEYKTNTADFTPLLKRLKTLNPDVVFIPGYERDCGIILRQAGTLGIKFRFLGGDGWGNDILRVAGSSAEGSYYLTQWHPDYPSQKSRQLVELFRKRYPDFDENSIMLPLTYDAVSLMADAISRAGSTETNELKKALQETADYPGVTGLLSFDSTGDPVSRSATILQFSNGDSHFFKAISFP